MSIRIHTQELVKRYGKRTVVNHASVEVKQGEIVGLLGPNGAGKTTTFYMVVGLIKPDEGVVYLDDRDITKLAEMGTLDPIVGREEEIERVSQILSRRKKNNPILIGEPGVGKTAIVEGLALRIVQRKVSRVLFVALEARADEPFGEGALEF